MCTEYNPQEVSWRIKIIKNKQTKKSPHRNQFFPPILSLYLLGAAGERNHSKSKTKKARGRQTSS